MAYQLAGEGDFDSQCHASGDSLEDSIFVIEVYNNSAWATVDVQTEGMNWLKWNIP